MALIHADFVEETTTTTGTGTLDLAGATTGHRTFVAAIGTSNTCIYAIASSDGYFESGVGTITDGTPDTLARTTLLSSSTGSKLDLPAGTHKVYCTFAAEGGAKVYAIPEVGTTPGTVAAGDDPRFTAVSAVSTAVAQTAHGFTAIGTPIYSADGVAWDVADASTAATIHLGVVSAIADADHFTLQQSGWITGVDLVTLTAGQFYYLSDAGSLSTTPGTINAPVLFATSSSSGVVLPFRAFDAAGSTTQPEYSELYQALAAGLEPDAIEPLQTGTFTYTVAASATKLLLSSWQTQLGTAGRFELRNPQKSFPLRGASLHGTGSDSFAVFLDPTLPVYASPKDSYFSRLTQLLYSLPTRKVDVVGGSAKVPFLPGAYGAIITGVTCFDLAWLVLRARSVAGINLWDEVSDSTIQRIGDVLSLPVSKTIAGEIHSSVTGTGTGTVAFVLLPSTWSGVSDPTDYTFRDDFMGTALDTGVWTRAQSTVGKVEISSVYQWCSLFGSSSWGANGLYRTQTQSRTEGLTFVCDYYAGQDGSQGFSRVGWNSGSGLGDTAFAHAVNFAGSNIINIIEGATNRGTVAAWVAGTIYRIKIVLHSDGSASYYLQGGTYQPIGSATWTSIDPSTSSSATNTVTPGGSAWAGSSYISDIRVFQG